jgi:hypothetical protein
MTGSDDAATIAHQSLAQLGGRSSILVKQRADHPRLDRLIDRARATRAAGGREHAVALRQRRGWCSATRSPRSRCCSGRRGGCCSRAIP